jgi:anti-anti-sigma factor
MQSSPNSLSVGVAGKVVWVRITGRANVNCSLEFKSLLTTLKDRGLVDFVLDLRECSLMDSTFLGVLVGQARSAPGAPTVGIELFQPGARILEVLDNLGVAHLFPTHAGNDTLAPETLTPLPAPAGKPDRKETVRTSFEAHVELMKAHEGNVPKFKDVTAFLAEDLRRLEAAG